MDRVQTLPQRPDFPFQEPSGWDDIRAARPAAPDLPRDPGALRTALPSSPLLCLLSRYSVMSK